MIPSAAFALDMKCPALEAARKIAAASARRNVYSGRPVMQFGPRFPAAPAESAFVSPRIDASVALD
jgi:hypothetical protein